MVIIKKLYYDARPTKYQVKNIVCKSVTTEMATMRIFEIMGSKFNLHGLLLKWWVHHRNHVEEDDEDDDDDEAAAAAADDDARLTNECPEL